jgi:hypothetical protein
LEPGVTGAVVLKSGLVVIHGSESVLVHWEVGHTICNLGDYQFIIT